VRPTGCTFYAGRGPCVPAASGVLVPVTDTVYSGYRTNRASILDADRPAVSFTKLEPEPGKWPTFCELSGRYWRLIWPPYRPQALHSNWCLKIVPFSVHRSGQINRQFTGRGCRPASATPG